MFNEIKIKIIIIGDSSTGKSSIMKVFETKDKYLDSTSMTVGVEFINIKEIINNRNLTVTIYDTTGQERFRAITRNFYKGSDGVFLVYSINDKLSFENIKKWNLDLESTHGINPIKVLLASKSDLNNKRQVTKIEGENKANEIGAKFFETSSKENQNIKESFDYMVNSIYQIKKDETHQQSSIQITAGKDKSKGCCY